MNIQIFGRNKCFETKKAERYFKERRIKFQYIDLELKGLSKGELSSIKKNISINEMINDKSKEYKALSLDKIRSIEVKEEIILKNPKILKTPIVRNKNLATIGYKKEEWDSWE